MKRFAILTLLALAATPAVADPLDQLSLFGMQLGSTAYPGDYGCVKVADPAAHRSAMDVIMWGGVSDSYHLTPLPGKDICLAGDVQNGFENTATEIAGKPFFRETLPLGFSNITVMVGRNTHMIDSIHIITHGIQDQDFVLATLEQKFGTPMHLQTPEMQNSFGAKFTAISAEWDFKDGAVLTFDSANYKSDFGNIEAKSPMVVTQQKNNIQAYRANERPL